MRKWLSLSQSDVSVDRRLTVGTPSGFNAKSLLKRLSVAALFLFAFMGNAWADYSSTFTDKNLSVGTGELSWTADPAFNSFEKSGDQRCAQSSKATTDITLTSATVSGTITEITVVCSANVAGSMSATIGGNAFGVTSSFAKNIKHETIKFTGSTTVTDEAITLTITRSGNGTFWIESVIVKSGSTEPAVSVDPEALAFGDQKQNVAVEAKTFKLTAENLTAGLTLAASNGYTVSPTELTKDAAMAEGGVTVTVTPAIPTAAGANNGTVTISGDDLTDDVTVNLTMNVVETFLVQVVVNDAEMGTATINDAASVYTDGNDELNIVAEAKPGYEFENWTVSDGETLEVTNATSKTTTLTAIAAGTITANFKALSCSALAAPTLNGEIQKTYNSATIVWNQVENADGYVISVVKNETSEAIISNESMAGLVNTTKIVDGLDANTQYDYTIYAKGDGTTYCDENNPVLEGSFTTADYPAATLTLSENGVERAFGEDLKLNNVVTLPTEAQNACFGKVLVGWSKDAERATAPEYAAGDNYTIAATADKLYAVYATEIPADPANETYKLVNALTVGKKYIFASSNAAGSAYALPAKDMVTSATSPVSGVEITISTVDEVPTIATLNTDLEYLLEKIMLGGGDTLALQVVANPTNYLCINGSGFNQRATGYKAFWNNGLYGTNGAGSSKYYAEVDGSGFKKGGSSTTKPVYAYERTAGASSYDHYATTCVTPELSSITLSYATVECWKGEEMPKPVVTAHFNEGAADQDVTTSATFSGFNAELFGEEQTITVSYEYEGVTKEATYKVTVKTIANDAEHPYTVAQAIALIDAGKDLSTKVYVRGIVSSKTFFTNSNTFNVFVKDDLEDDASFEFYMFYKDAELATFEAENDITEKDILVGYGELTKFNSTYEFKKECYLISRIAYIPTYVVNFTAPTNGTLTIMNGEEVIENGAAFAAGSTLDVKTAAINNFYELEAVVVKDAEENDVTESVYEAGVLTVPAYAITVSATFKEKVFEETTEWKEIAFTEDAIAGTVKDSVFYVENTGFRMTCVDPKGVVSIDGNTQSFGDESAHTQYTKRLKMNGNGISNNVALTFNIPADGILRIAVRTGSNTATDRPVVVYQNEVEIYRDLTDESKDKVGNYYQYRYVNVKKGTAIVTNDVNSINFYAFAYRALAKPEVTIAENENGTIIVKDGETPVASGEKVLEGTELTITAEANEEYNLTGITVNGAALESSTYTMGTEAVTIAATFVQKTYAVTYENPANGTLVVKKDGEAIAADAKFAKGTVLTVEAEPKNANYKLATLTANSENILSAMQFTVGSADVVVAAAFEIVIPEHMYLKNNWNNGDWAWAEMTYASEDQSFQLKNAVIGNGGGVNYYTEESEAMTLPWKAYEELVEAAGLEMEMGALDTVDFTYSVANDALTISNLRKYVAPKFYITGEGEALGSWNPSAIVSKTDSYTLHLEAGEYQMKITLNGSWNPAEDVKGFADLTEKAEGLNNVNGNIAFTLAEAGDVTVTYTGEVFKVEGNFYVDVAPVVYTVVGVEPLVGYYWGDGLNATENEMTKQEDGTYKLVKEMVELAAGDYEYQVAQNHYWRGVDNSTLSITQDGKYDVTFTFKPADGTTNATADLKEHIEIDPEAIIRGTLTDWAYAEKMTLSADKKSASMTINIEDADSTYILKMFINNNAWLSNNYAFTRDNNQSANIETNWDPGMTLYADIAGEYTFTWTFETNTLEITYPALPAAKYYIAGVFTGWSKTEMTENEGIYSATIAINTLEEQSFKVVRVQGPYETWYGLQEYAAMTAENCTDWVVGESIGEAYQANIGLTPTKAGDYTFTFNAAENKVSVALPALTLANGYYLIGQYGFEVSALASDLKFTESDIDGQFKLDVTLQKDQQIKVVEVYGDAITVWYPANENNYIVDAQHVGSTTVYFRPDGQGNDDWFERYFFVVPTSDDPTALDNVAGEEKPVKIVRGDKVYIVKGDKIYNITGQLVR